jgi:hypothetical protein
MPPETTEARVSVLEAQVADLRADVNDYRGFKESMISQFTELKAAVAALNWKVGGIIGIVVLIGNFLTQWGLARLFH